MSIKPTKRILTGVDAAIPGQISKNLLGMPSVNDEDCPWVQIGKVFVSITMTGATSWAPLIARLGGKQRYVVFTGRHGDIPNLVNGQGATIGVFDRTHYEEDARVATRVRSDFPGIALRLVDTGARPRGQTFWLREQTKNAIARGETVIYAWCYGLFTFCELPDPAGITARGSATIQKSHADFLTNQSIYRLVKDHWYWLG